VKKWILILEDNPERREAMEKWLAERLSMYGRILTDDPGEFLRHLAEHESDVLVVSLDHDLHERPDGNTTLTGMLVVDRLVEMPATFPVLLHTSNRHDGARMESRLLEADWKVTWVKPFEDTVWVGTDWYPALKRAIRSAARRERVPDADDRD
jgi:CheY-like chemotaxis protein